MAQSKTKRTDHEKTEVPGPNSTFAEVVSYLQKHDGLKRADELAQALDPSETPSADTTPILTNRAQIEESETKRPSTSGNIQSKTETLQIKTPLRLKRTAIRAASINLVLELT
jgi:hypothetical protein